MHNIRLNLQKTLADIGLPTCKGTLYLIYVDDIIEMPTQLQNSVLTDGDFDLVTNANVYQLYLTSETQEFNRTSEGKTDLTGFKDKIVGNFPGDSLQVNDFVFNNVNTGFVIVEDIHDGYLRIHGSKNNPLFLSPTYTSSVDKNSYNLVFEQAFKSAVPILFYTGTLSVISNDPNNPGNFITITIGDSRYALRNATNITAQNAIDWRTRLGINSYSYFINVGETVINGSEVTLVLHSSGSNSVGFGTVIKEKSTSDTFSFTPVVANNREKILLLYAKNDSQLFYLIEGIEAQTAIQPTVPTGGIVISKIKINNTSATIYPIDYIPSKANSNGSNLLTNDILLWRNILQLYSKTEIDNLLVNINFSSPIYSETTITQNNISNNSVIIYLIEPIDMDKDISVYYNGVFIPQSIFTINGLYNFININLASMGVLPQDGDTVVIKYFKK